MGREVERKTPKTTRVQPVAGVRLGIAAAKIRYRRPDVALLELATDSVTAAVFTTNRFSAAPVEVAREHLRQVSPRYLLINSGCANAGLGQAGVAAARACCDALAGHGDVDAAAVLPFSTGVIGEPLPVNLVTACLPSLLENLSEDAGQWSAAAAAIMTTDTYPKTATRVIETDNGVCRITGMAKGSGMIAPNMATMLAFVATDAVLTRDDAETLLKQACEESFHRVVVDGDTSTNDACTFSATGRSGVTLAQVGRSRMAQALTEVMQSLAKDMARDGEGATRLVTIEVSGAADTETAKAVARSVALSPLVKTAIFAGDPNWGRMVAAIGYAVAEFDFSRMRFYIGERLVFADGERAAEYDESAVAKQMSKDELTLRVVLSDGAAQATFWTCDYSTDYVTINASYRS